MKISAKGEKARMRSAISTSPAHGGFTLIELSIVLVIIGLIAGGILVGREMISAAEIRATITQIEKYKTATNTFRVKYGYLPGDISDPVASQYGFIPRSACGTMGQGDGNGLIEGYRGACGGFPGDGLMVFRGETGVFWVDLSMANLMDGSFTTADITNGASLTTAQIPLYAPKAKIGRGNYIYVWSGGYTLWGNWYYNGLMNVNDGANYFGLSALTFTGPTGRPISDTALTPSEAYNIDSKTDDGMPQSGKVTAMYDTQSTRVTNWAAGGGSWHSGDMDVTTFKPITAQTVTPLYVSTFGLVLSDTCFNNGDTLAPEQYSVANTGLNCALSFRF